MRPVKNWKRVQMKANSKSRVRSDTPSVAIGSNPPALSRTPVAVEMKTAVTSKRIVSAISTEYSRGTHEPRSSSSLTMSCIGGTWCAFQSLYLPPYA